MKTRHLILSAFLGLLPSSNLQADSPSVGETYATKKAATSAPNRGSGWAGDVRLNVIDHVNNTSIPEPGMSKARVLPVQFGDGVLTFTHLDRKYSVSSQVKNFTLLLYERIPVLCEVNEFQVTPTGVQLSMTYSGIAQYDSIVKMRFTGRLSMTGVIRNASMSFHVLDEHGYGSDSSAVPLLAKLAANGAAGLAGSIASMNVFTRWEGSLELSQEASPSTHTIGHVPGKTLENSNFVARVAEDLLMSNVDLAASGILPTEASRAPTRREWATAGRVLTGVFGTNSSSMLPPPYGLWQPTQVLNQPRIVVGEPVAPTPPALPAAQNDIVSWQGPITAILVSEKDVGVRVPKQSVVYEFKLFTDPPRVVIAPFGGTERPALLKPPPFSTTMKLDTRTTILVTVRTLKVTASEVDLQLDYTGNSKWRYDFPMSGSLSLKGKVGSHGMESHFVFESEMRNPLLGHSNWGQYEGDGLLRPPAYP